MNIKTYFLLIFYLLLSYSLPAQILVSGSVQSSDGVALIGVNVLEIGTVNGTVTDEQGKYSLVVSSKDAFLVFSYTGYEAFTLQVGDLTIINPTLELDINLLDQVVVSALGFKERKDKMGSTASVINTKDILRSGESVFLNGLGAKASNLQISRTNGDPGAGTTIRIRGANSITGSSNPLIILDGIPISNQTIYEGGNNARDEGVAQQSRLHDLNPNDIESVQILKGASAAALWGSRAANGVLVITTKNGIAGKTSIDYGFTVSFDQLMEELPLQKTWGQGRSGRFSATGAEAWGDYIADRSGEADELDKSGAYFEANNGNRYYPILKKNSKETFVEKNLDATFQTGGFLQHNLDISGGNSKNQFFLSLGRLDQEGILRNNHYDRTNVRLNNKALLNNWLNVETHSSYTQSNSNRIQQGSSTAGVMLGLLRTPPDFDNSDYIGTYVDKNGAIFPNRQRAYRRYLGEDADPNYNNPLWATNEQKANTNVHRYIFSGDFNILPTKFMQIKLRGGIDGYTDSRSYFYPVGSSKEISGELSEEAITNLESNFDAIVKSNFKINQYFTLNTTLGWNYNANTFKRNFTRLQGFAVNIRKPTSALNSAAEASQYENFSSNVRSNRGYLVLNFELYNRLFINTSGTIEAASTIKNRFFYPSIDAAYQLVNANNTNTILDFVKLRASFGQVGIQPPAYTWETLAEGNFSYGSVSEPSDIALFGGGFRIGNTKGNADIEPEIKTEWEVGTDFRFKNSNIGLGITYYQNKIEGIIIPLALTPSSGFAAQIDNAASMENKGLEVEADAVLFRKGNFSLNSFANWSFNRNEVLNLRGAKSINLTPEAYVSSRVVEGEPLGVLYGTGSKTDDNGRLLLNENGFPQLTESPVLLGDPNPDWIGGFGLGIQWKNLFANAVIEHSQGGVYSPRTIWVLKRFGVLEETAQRITLEEDLVNYAGKVIPAGTTVRGNITNFGAGAVLLDESWYRSGIGGGSGDNQAYNFSLYDATFTRFKEISVGYVFKNTSFQEKTKLGVITIRFSGRNLFLIDDIPGIDPETHQYGVSNSRGLDYYNNPTSKSYLISVQISY